MSVYSRLPPLNALRAFEAAARLGSFVEAADELNVTPAAVSHQVKALEASVGVKLFERHARGLEVTQAGRTAQPLIADGLDAFVQGVLRMREGLRSDRLLISVTQSFAIWLISRIERFNQVHPGVEPLLDATNRLADMDRDEVDIGIRYGAGNYEGLYECQLLREKEFPVCSPDYLKNAPPLRTPQDLKDHALIHIDWWGEEDLFPTWKMWLLANGVTEPIWRKGPRFHSGVMACHAALEGHGIAMGSQLLVSRDMADGRLVRPFEVAIGAPEEFGFYFVCAERRKDEPEIRAFREWLIGELRVAFGDECVAEVETV